MNQTVEDIDFNKLYSLKKLIFINQTVWGYWCDFNKLYSLKNQTVKGYRYWFHELNSLKIPVLFSWTKLFQDTVLI